MMRTTLTIDDHTVALLKEIAHQSGKPFKQVVNEALRLGINQLENPEPQAYRLRPASLGSPRAGVDVDKALHLAADLEDEALAAKLEQRK
jgi:hypothetical protein